MGARVPDWFHNRKLGIFIHWGVYSVPAKFHEWYPRIMYIQNSPEWQYHRDTYGSQERFGYKDFIPMFRAESFDAREWMTLFRATGGGSSEPLQPAHAHGGIPERLAGENR